MKINGFRSRIKAELFRESSKFSKWLTVTLCLFAIIGYGIYLFQLFRSSLSFASKYSQYMNLIQILELLYLFGKLGLVAFAMVESIILVRYVKSGSMGFKQSIYFLILVIISNLLIYFFMSYLYRNAYTGIQ